MVRANQRVSGAADNGGLIQGEGAGLIYTVYRRIKGANGGGESQFQYIYDYSVFFVFDLGGVINRRTVGASRGGMGVGLARCEL